MHLVAIWILSFTIFFSDGRPGEKYTIGASNPIACEQALHILGDAALAPQIDHVDINKNCLEDRES